MYKHAPYYEDMIQDIRIYLLGLIRNNKEHLFKRYLMNRIMRSRDLNRNTMHIPEYQGKNYEYKTVDNEIILEDGAKALIFDLMPCKEDMGQIIEDRVYLIQNTTEKELEVLDLLNKGYNKTEVGKILGMSSAVCYKRLKGLKNKMEVKDGRIK